MENANLHTNTANALAPSPHLLPVETRVEVTAHGAKIFGVPEKLQGTVVSHISPMSWVCANNMVIKWDDHVCPMPHYAPVKETWLSVAWLLSGEFIDVIPVISEASPPSATEPIH